MNEDQFSAMLTIIVPPIIEQITKYSNVDDDIAISRFYQSNAHAIFSFYLITPNCMRVFCYKDSSQFILNRQ